MNVIKNPQWVDAEEKQVILTIIDGAGEYPFIADPNDCVETGRALFERCLEGEFGEIQPFVKHMLSTTELAEQGRGTRDALLLELDKLVSNPLRFASFSAEQKSDLASYRQALLDVPQQDSFPTSIIWPVIPQDVAEGHITP